jgi:hypothetical protein
MLQHFKQTLRCFPKVASCYCRLLMLPSRLQLIRIKPLCFKVHQIIFSNDKIRHQFRKSQHHGPGLITSNHPNVFRVMQPLWAGRTGTFQQNYAISPVCSPKVQCIWLRSWLTILLLFVLTFLTVMLQRVNAPHSENQRVPSCIKGQNFVVIWRAAPMKSVEVNN